MEIIKNYLETMFATMPNTESVRKAKRELLQMMEDKYNELISEGVSENTAVGTVISEFGNLDELADDLGVTEELKKNHQEQEQTPRHQVTLDQAKQYICDTRKKGLFVGLGVLFCIISIAWPTLFAESSAVMYGVLAMFLSIGIGVGCIVYGCVSNNKWDFVKKTPCQIDMITANYLSEEKEKFAGNYAIRLTIGIVLCVICWLPVIVFETNMPMLEMLGCAMLFFFVGIGVMLIISSNYAVSSYETLLSLNNPKTVSGHYVKEQELEWKSDTAKLVMELYWPAIACVYLCVSFLTFEWGITWVIWPVAAAIHKILKVNLVKSV